MKELTKNLEKKYRGIRYSNLIKGRNNEWWFTITPRAFINSTLHLMLIHKLYKRVFVIKIDTETQLKDIIPRKDGVHLSGQYDLYFTLDSNIINIKYLTQQGHRIEDFSSNVIESIELTDFQFIESIEELKDNLLTIESYLDLDYSERERDFALSLIQKGKNLVVYKVQNEFHFAPSRFVGYKSNDIDKHILNETKDGKDTTPIINLLSGNKLSFNQDIENAYMAYCKALNLEIHKNKRQYWIFDFSGTSFEKLINTQGYKEGKVLYYKHKKRERNRKLVEDAKNAFKQKNENRLYCEICTFNFLDIYGIDYIEVHHLKAVADMKDDEITNIEDVCLVCPNCHRIIHSKIPYFSVSEVKALIEKNKLHLLSKKN